MSGEGAGTPPASGASPAPSVPARPATRGWRRWARRLAWALLGLLLLGLGFAIWVWATCFAVPPPLAPADEALRGQTPTTDAAGRRHLGPSWFLPRPGGSLLYVEGSPYARGYASSALTADLLERQERELMQTVERFVPSRAKRLGLGLLVLLNNRSLPGFVSPDLQQEIRGLADGRSGPDPYPHLGSRYHRVLNYHAAHDISHWVWDRPPAGCTAFVARGARSAGGGLLVGRAFDWEAGRHFDENKVIALVRPGAGHAFLSVAWPGMAGAVTGLNERRVWCSLNGAHSADRGRIGRPVSLVVREVLEQADDLEEAIAIISAAPVFVADSYLVADGKSGQAAVVERTPARAAVRRIEGPLLLQTNHFETPELSADPGNVAYLAEGTSQPRRDRLAELLAARQEPLDPTGAVAILRDRLGPGGAPRALGHRGTIDGLVATHAVVADLSRGILWVSRGPCSLGAFEAHALESFGGPPPAAPIPADPLLERGGWETVSALRAAVAAAQAAPADAPLPDPLREELERVLYLEPRDPGALLLLARDARRRGQPRQARVLLERAEAAAPPFLLQRQELARALEELP